MWFLPARSCTSSHPPNKAQQREKSPDQCHNARYAPRDLAIPWLIYVGILWTILCWLVVSTPLKILVSWDDSSKQPTSIYYHILLYTIYTYSDPELWLNNDLVKYYSIANLKCHTHIHDVRRLQDSYIYIYIYIHIHHYWSTQTILSWTHLM